MLESIPISEAGGRFLSGVKGSQVIIPDLYALLPGWRFEINVNYDSVKNKMDRWLESWMESDSIRQRMQIADFAMLAACLYPDASEEEHLMTSYYHLWVFLWDDQLDCGPLTRDPEKAQLYNKSTNTALTYTLGEHPFSGHTPPMDPVMVAFSTVADKVAAGTTADARHRILLELQSYVDTASLLPFRRNNGETDLLTVSNFMKQRKASGGCGTSTSLILYVYHLDIPTSILDHEAMRMIWDQTCMIGHLINDIVSFPKELADNQLDNIVPVLALENKISLQEAIYSACDLVREARDLFEDAEKRVPIPTGNADLDEQIKRYVLACRDVAAGNLNWSYLGVRYFGKNPRREGNKTFLQILP